MEIYTIFLNFKKHKFIILMVFVLISILLYLQWSNTDSINMPSAINHTQHRYLHYYSSYGLGVVLERFLWDSFIFFVIYPIIIIYRFYINKQNKYLKPDNFFKICFIALIFLNILYFISTLNHIYTDNILGYIDYLFINIMKYEIYIPIIIYYVIENVLLKK